MKRIIPILSILMIFVITTAACSPKAASADQVPAVESTNEMKDAEPETIETAELQQADITFPAWYSMLLTDVNTGAVFTIEENLGKVILVETLATWCSNCYRQQTEVANLHDLLGERDDFISLGIDIDPNEDIPLLTGYVQKNGFDWLYVVANDEMIDEISSLYGPQYLNPPSTPMFIIDKNGSAHLLDFGIKDAQSLLNSVTPYLDESSS